MEFIETSVFTKLITELLPAAGLRQGKERKP